MISEVSFLKSECQYVTLRTFNSLPQHNHKGKGNTQQITYPLPHPQHTIIQSTTCHSERKRRISLPTTIPPTVSYPLTPNQQTAQPQTQHHQATNTPPRSPSGKTQHAQPQ